ncbi:MAG: sigma-E processing peptidase SpoIIGA [Bacillota bacterium]
MNTTVVYLDKFLLGNLLVDWIILWAAGRLGRIRVKYHRLLLGAIIGSLYSLALFLPGTDSLSPFYVKFVVSLVMMLAAFAPVSPRMFFACLFFFYVVSFAVGGTVIGVSYFLSQSGGIARMYNLTGLVNRYLWPVLLLALAAVWAGVDLVPGFFKGRNRFEAMKLSVTIYMEGRGITVRGLVDTGNSLRDPVTGEPVLVVEYGAIKDLLPEPMRVENAYSGNGASVIEKMAGSRWSGRIRLIPFRSLGNDSGMLLGIKPDRIEFIHESRVRKVDRVIVAIHGKKFDRGEEYNAIVNPAVLA